MREELPKYDSIDNSFEYFLLIDRKSTGEILVVLEDLINMFSKSLAFWIEYSMIDSSLSFHGEDICK